MKKDLPLIILNNVVKPFSISCLPCYQPGKHKLIILQLNQY